MNLGGGRWGVGVVGLGFGARVHVPAFTALPEVRVVAVCARNARRAADVAAAVGARAYTDWHDLLADERVEIVSIATPPALHAVIAGAAIDAGKAVICEKPLGVNAQESARLASRAEAAGLPNLVAFEFRAVPSVARARVLLAEVALGPLLRIDVRWHVPSRATARVRRSWKDRSAQGGGVLLGLGVHVLDYLEWLAGPFQSIRGNTWTTLDRCDPLRSEDSANAVGNLEPDVPVSISLSSAGAIPLGHRIEIECARGRLVIENPDVRDYVRGFRLHLVENGATTMLVPPVTGAADGRIEPLTQLFAAFLAHVGEVPLNVPSFRAGARAQALAAEWRADGRVGAPSHDGSI